MNSWSECPNENTICSTDDWCVTRWVSGQHGPPDNRAVHWAIVTKNGIRIDLNSDLVGDPSCRHIHNTAIDFSAAVRAGNDCYIALTRTSNVDANWAVREGDTEFDFAAQSVGCGFVIGVPGTELAQALADDLVLVTGLEF